jgi:NADH-quinone oxidoreductase subunit A
MYGKRQEQKKQDKQNNPSFWAAAYTGHPAMIASSHTNEGIASIGGMSIISQADFLVRQCVFLTLLIPCLRMTSCLSGEEMGAISDPSRYIPIAVFILIALGFGVVTILMGYLVRPRRPYKQKLFPYESGMDPITDPHQMFPLRYYLIAMLFVLFDIEVVFLYPWAVSFKSLGLFALIEMVLFISILLVGYFYAWKKGALEWD